MSFQKLNQGFITNRWQLFLFIFFFIYIGTNTLKLPLLLSSPHEWDIHSAAVRINGRRCHQSSLVHRREFSTAFCLSAAATQSSSSTRTRPFSAITSGFWLSSAHKGRATRESLTKSVVLSEKEPRTLFDGSFCVAFLYANLVSRVHNPKQCCFEHLSWNCFVQVNVRLVVHSSQDENYQMAFCCTLEEEFLIDNFSKHRHCHPSAL